MYLNNCTKSKVNLHWVTESIILSLTVLGDAARRLLKQRVCGAHCAPKLCPSLS